jgi:hypothetical protein
MLDFIGATRRIRTGYQELIPATLDVWRRNTLRISRSLICSLWLGDVHLIRPDILGAQQESPSGKCVRPPVRQVPFEGGVRDDTWKLSLRRCRVRGG